MINAQMSFRFDCLQTGGVQRFKCSPLFFILINKVTVSVAIKSFQSGDSRRPHSGLFTAHPKIKLFLESNRGDDGDNHNCISYNGGDDNDNHYCIIGQRESFFRSRDENESFSDSISFIETRPRVPDTYSQASRRDREFLTLTLGHRDEIEIYYLHSQASRREREFPWSNLSFRDENENSNSCHLSLNSGLNGLTVLNAISGRLLYKMQGSTFCLAFSHFGVTQWHLISMNEILLRYILMLIMERSGCSASLSSSWLLQQCPLEPFPVLPNWRPAVSTW